MEESHYRALLDEVRSDVAEAERTIEEAKQTIADLANLEQYLLGKVGGSGGGGGSKKKQRSDRENSRKADSRKDDSSLPGGGMHTVEFGPDGFPKA